ncbi:hypothetical protein H5410_001270, partial [Solanum commersonii]
VHRHPSQSGVKIVCLRFVVTLGSDGYHSHSIENGTNSSCWQPYPQGRVALDEANVEVRLATQIIPNKKNI